MPKTIDDIPRLRDGERFDGEDLKTGEKRPLSRSAYTMRKTREARKRARVCSCGRQMDPARRLEGYKTCGRCNGDEREAPVEWWLQ